MPTTNNATDSQLTANNVITGAANNLPNNVAPSATSGVPLISQGAASQPAFGTAVVAGGGTGDVSFTAYSVITGGTTSTGALQNVSGVGTSGQVLTSAGAAALPTWQSNPPAVFQPNAIVNFFEDFFGLGGSGTILQFDYQWGAGTTGQWSITTPVLDSGHPGQITNNSFTTGGAVLYLASSTLTYSQILLGGGAIIINWVFKIVNLSTGTNRYDLFFGLTDTSTIIADAVNGVYFRYSDNVNSGSWTYGTAASSVRSFTNSGTAVTAGWHNAQININAGATSCSFSMDGVSLGAAVATNIPTVGIAPTLNIQGVAGTTASGSINVDLVYMTQTLTSAR